MNQDNKKFFWIVCFVTVVVAIYWSAMSVMQQPRPLFIAFLVINLVSLIITTVCLIFDIRKNKIKK